MGKRSRYALVLVGVVGVILVPDPAFAHGIGGRADLPVPLEFFIFGAALVLVVSFVALAVLWPEPRLQEGTSYEPGDGRSRPTWLTFVLGGIGLLSLLLVIGQIVPELAGMDSEPGRPTIAPVTVWVLFWLVVPFGAALIGNWYTDLNPWRVVGTVFGSDERPEILERWSVWPATVAFVAFTWLELVSPSSGEPAVLGLAALGYTFAMVGAMGYAGRDAGLQAFDAFTSYNRLISAISPIGRDATGSLVWRGWLRSLPALPEWKGLWVFVAAAIGTVSFDGASSTEWFRTVTGGIGDNTLGSTFLLVASVVVIGGGYLGASAVAARLSAGDWTARRVAQRFAHTLVPIAVAYAVAHYFTLILFEGQQIIAAVSDPFGLGWDLFGTQNAGSRSSSRAQM